MEEMKQTTVVMTAEEKAEFEAFQREKAKKAAEEKAKNEDVYKRQALEWSGMGRWLYLPFFVL